MTRTVLPGQSEPPRHRRWLPLGDPSRPRRLAKVFAWLAGIAVALAVIELLGVDVLGWFADVWDALSAIGLGYLLAGWTLQCIKTSLTAFAWFSILRVAFPDGRVAFLQILAAYAAGVALNGFLPANLGTAVMLLMFVAIIPGANLPGVLGGMIVHKIFFSLAGAFVYVYLILSASGSLEVELPVLDDRPVVVLALVAGAATLLVILGRIFWSKLQGLWAKAVQGGAILARRRDYLLRVALPSFGAWLAKLGVIAIFLAGYGITVTFHTVMSVVGSGSIANVVSVTPGGVGVNQAADIAALHDVTDTATATAYSIGQQLAITAFNVAFAVVLVIWAFGWTGGKLLVAQSYTDAKVKVEEQKSQRARRRGVPPGSVRR